MQRPPGCLNGQSTSIIERKTRISFEQAVRRKLNKECGRSWKRADAVSACTSFLEASRCIPQNALIGIPPKTCTTQRPLSPLLETVFNMVLWPDWQKDFTPKQVEGLCHGVRAAVVCGYLSVDSQSSPAHIQVQMGHRFIATSNPATDYMDLILGKRVYPHIKKELSRRIIENIGKLLEQRLIRTSPSSQSMDAMLNNPVWNNEYYREEMIP
ncbi:MAG: hypothetical protein L6Q57_06030 [Alphaproteobacteria bacterium]|nr:hypothetical protein [Alphaproteobacteria bacterium]